MKITTAKACIVSMLKVSGEQESLKTWVSLAGSLGKLYDTDKKLTKPQRKKVARKRVEAAIREHFTVERISQILKKQEKKNKNFYNSDEWRRLRYKVLRKYGGRCQLCGRSYKEDGVKIHVDHIKPRSKYPELELDENNLQILCEDCNLGKMARDRIDWR